MSLAGLLRRWVVAGAVAGILVLLLAPGVGAQTVSSARPISGRRRLRSARTNAPDPERESACTNGPEPGPELPGRWGHCGTRDGARMLLK